MRKIVLILLLLTIAVPCVLVIAIALESPRRPKMSVVYAGYAKDLSGAPSVRFAVTNSEPSAVRWSPPVIFVQTSEGTIGRMVQGGALLEGRSGTLIKVGPPTNQTWKLRLNVYTDIGAVRDVKEFVTYTLLKLRLRPRYQTMPYSIESDWIENTE